jgi:hypothetical protein
MTLLREALDIGALPSTATVRRAFELLERDLGQPSTLTNQQRDDIDRTLDEIRETLTNDETCRRVRRIFQDLGILGCASARRIAAIAASLGIDPEALEDCLEKTDEEREEEEDAEIDLELESPDEPPLDEDAECPVDLITWLCLPPERIPEEDQECDPAPLPGAEDTRTFDPFPTVPDIDDALQLCRFAENRIQLAQGTGEILSKSTLTGFLRMFHALAFRPNPPPGILYKTCTEDAMQRLTEYWASGIVDPPTPAQQQTIEQINDELFTYTDQLENEISNRTDIIEGVTADMKFYGLTKTEALPWIAQLEADLAAAKALGTERIGLEIQRVLDTIKQLIKDSNVDPHRPLPPGLEYPSGIPDIDDATRKQSVERYIAFLTDKQARGLDLDPHETEYLAEIAKDLEPDE